MVNCGHNFRDHLSSLLQHPCKIFIFKNGSTKTNFFWKNSEPSCFLYFWHVYIGSEWIQWHLIWVLNILHIYIVFLIFWEGIKSVQVCQSLRYYEVIIRIDLAKYKLYVKPSLRGNFELCQMVKKRQENR